MLVFFLQLSLVFAATSWAKFPEKPIVLIMPYPAGGGTDISMRPLVNAAGRVLEQQVVIEYHPGGSAAVGLGILKIRKPDGYTIGMTPSVALTNQYTRKVNYDLIKDFTPIMQYADYNYGLVVNSDSPWRTLRELTDYAKSNPGKVRFASTGPSDRQSLVMSSLAKQLGIHWIHIPFEGGPPALAALLGGHVEAYSTTMHVKSQVASGRLRLLATYGEKRNPSFPDVPTLGELGFKTLSPTFMAIVGPKGIPPQIVETIHQAFKKGLEDPAFVKACEVVDHSIIYRSPAETAQLFNKVDDEVKNILEDLKLRK